MSFSKELVAQAKQFSEKLLQFINQSPSPFHAVDICVKRLEKSGYKRLSEKASWAGHIEKNGRYFFTRGGTSIVAFAVGGKFEPQNGLKIVGAHTDSPNLQVKPASAHARVGFQQLSVATYGGGLWHTWFDRDLKLAGRAFVRSADSTLTSKLVHIDRPVVRVPTLCIHLQSGDERAAFKVNKEEHLRPILCTAVMASLQQAPPESQTPAGGQHHAVLLSLLSEQLGCAAEDIVDFELSVVDSQPAQLGGVFEEFLFAPRLDNLASCFCALEALLSADGLAEDPQCRVVCLFDHEEVGSESMAGAGSTHIQSLLTRLMSGLAGSEAAGSAAASEKACVAARQSFLISADMAHAVHPCYPNVHHELHRPEVHKGVVIKMHANKRYSTDSTSQALLSELARGAGVPIQLFTVGNETPCGSTIGPTLSTNTGIPSIDVGCGQLSMHSIRETCGTVDMLHYTNLFKAFYQNFHTLKIADQE
eukprot:RCo005934